VVDPSPQDELTRLMSGYWHTQAIYVAAKLGVADHLKDGPRSAEQLAVETGANPRALYRLLRALASLGIFIEDSQYLFALTPMADCLRSDRPGSARALAIMRGEWQYETWGHLLHSVRTGQSAFEKMHGMPIFDYLSHHPDKGRLFDDAMTGVHGRETAAMLEAYDFAGIGTLADIGGGNGEVLSSVLKKHPAMRGILFDLPAVAERTKGTIAAAGLADRRRQLLRGRAARRRRLPAAAHHPRLGRRQVHRHPWQLPQGGGEHRQAAGGGGRDSAGERAVDQQVLRPGDDGPSRRHGAHAGRISPPP
jgi:hypothetical protein